MERSFTRALSGISIATCLALAGCASGGSSAAGSSGGAGGGAGGTDASTGAGGSSGGAGGQAAAGGTAGTAGVGGFAGGQGGGAGTDLDAGSDADADVDSGGPSCVDEVCNGLDDDCDGAIDEEDPGGGENCDVPGAEGICQEGVTQCVNGLLECIQLNQPAVEECDGVDNNCNGAIDEGNPGGDEECGTGLEGVCGFGTSACESGGIVCEQNVQAQPEVCNGLDDDCNGIPDDGFGGGDPCQVPGFPPGSPCADGLTNCLTGQNSCTQVNFATSESCDGIDNDCDGTIDNPAVLVGVPCATGLMGVCSEGSTTCMGGVGMCVPTIMPGTQTETCNTFDDDCNGIADDVPNIALECGARNPLATNVTDWACTTGFCQVSGCTANFADCNGAPGDGCEVDTRLDENNCGGCGTICDSTNGTPFCDTGTCDITCDPGFGDCDGDPDNGCETDVTTDSSHCGACGVTCTNPSGATQCVASACIPMCDPNNGDCDGDPNNGCETNTNGDVNHCGGCGMPCVNPNGSTSCSGGSCNPTCNLGFADCDGDPRNGCETNLNADDLHCGACGIECLDVNAANVCQLGVCNPSCIGLFANCDGNNPNGCEQDIGSNVNHCGACSNQCTNPNGTTQCVVGNCTPSCAAGFGDCDGDPDDGCETNTNSNVNHCGACGLQCVNPNGTTSCSGGNCNPSCSSGFGDCDGDPTNGCETNEDTSVDHCGGCGIQCTNAHGTTQCTSGSCNPTCQSGWDDCDGNPNNGCETNINGDLNNCGACDAICDNPTGSESCVGGICQIGCDPGFGDCDMNSGNGCETNILIDPMNCGGCGIECMALNGTNSCVGGICTPVCNAGFDSCDGNPNNGCETNLLTSDFHCGTCGTQCVDLNGTNTCSSGTCNPSCNSGFGNCDGNNPNGCETSTATDEQNCGACGTVCQLTNASSNICSSGNCNPTCVGGFDNCDGNGANGCETNLSVDEQNCGSCGTECLLTGASSNNCSSGVCNPVCSGANDDCDGNPTNGCETNTNTSINNCGGCGIDCDSPLPPNTSTVTCSSGSCEVNTCNGTYYDQDGSHATGCECQSDTRPSVCSSAHNVGTVAENASVSLSGNTLPEASDSDWYRVTFSVATCQFNPRIEITPAVAGTPILMEVRRDSCSGGGISCLEGGTSLSSGKTVWEFTYSANCGNFQPIDPTPLVGPFIDTTDIPNPVSMWVRVFPNGSHSSCMDYDITFSN